MYKRVAAYFYLLFVSSTLCGNPIKIVAAENFYGEIAKQIGGSYVSVTSIMNNPNQDPHLFSTSANTAVSVAEADLIIYNGLDYDPWIINLIKANANQNKPIIVVADLVGKKTGDNPHIWYDPHTMLVFSDKLSEILGQLNPGKIDYFQLQLKKFNEDYKVLLKKIDQIKQRYQNTPVIATEPVFNYMANSLGLKMNGMNFQLSIMNDTEPSISDIKDFENNLTAHTVKVLIYNNQVINPMTERMQKLATKENIQVVGVSETEPSGENYLTWMLNELGALEKSLSKVQL